MTKVLVTGFIGSFLVPRLIEKELSVTLVDNSSFGKIGNLHIVQHNPNFSFMQGDIKNARAISLRRRHCFEKD
jgi:nucleoside-diphosphate-sugar epimerase